MTSPSSTFTLSDWFFPTGQSDALDPHTTNAAATSAGVGFPLASYTPVPEPTCLGLLAAGALMAMRRRRA
jgi:hypothetical protein